MAQALNTGRKPGMKASLMRHNGVTTLIITSMGKKIKDARPERKYGNSAWLNYTHVRLKESS